MLCGVEHPVENVQQRAEGWERGRPITIGANCWFDPGAVVNEDTPPSTLVAGVPARTIRSLT